MNTFADFKIKKQLQNALIDLGFEKPTPIQQESYSPILSGNDYVGIAQTGTGKTIAYLLPILQDLKLSNKPEIHPRILILVPTRELVIQIVEEVEKLIAYMDVKVLGVYGGSNNINSQKRAVLQGADIIVGTPRRLLDISLSGVLKLKNIKKLVIDEVDIMLDFGYKTQLNDIFDYLPAKRQNILFSATMTTYIDELINHFLINPIKKTIAVSGTPLENIKQESYLVPNFYTKVNLLNHLLKDKEKYNKVLIFVGTRTSADNLALSLKFPSEISVIHSGKEQNLRNAAIENFDLGSSRILIATDVIARGIDIDKISTVISFDTPMYPENYIHRIGRTGRAKHEGNSILFTHEKEIEFKKAIEKLMKYKIPLNKFPEEVEISKQISAEEKDKPIDNEGNNRKKPIISKGKAFHEKLAKNNREKTIRKSYDQILKERFGKPIKKGDKIQNMNSIKNRKKK